MYTNAVYGFTTTLIKILEDLKPDYIAASFDVSKATFRLKEYKEYKATRVAADQELYDQIPLVKELLNILNIPIYEMEGYEADDVIGSIADKFEINKCVISTEHEAGGKICQKDLSAPDKSGSRDDKIEVYVVTGDKDIFQLIDGNIFVYWLKKGLGETQIVDREVIQKEFNLQPEDFIDLKALAGDPSDNIPGVPHIGAKTATDLLLKFDSLKNLYQTLEDNFQVSIRQLADNFQSISNDPIFKSKCDKLEIRPRIAGLLIENKEQAFLSQKLATIFREVPIDFKLEDCQWGDYDKEKVREFFERMQFNSLLKRFGVLPDEKPKTKQTKEQKEKDEQLKLL